MTTQNTSDQSQSSKVKTMDVLRAEWQRTKAYYFVSFQVWLRQQGYA